LGECCGRAQKTARREDKKDEKSSDGMQMSHFVLIVLPTREKIAHGMPGIAWFSIFFAKGRHVGLDLRLLVALPQEGC
jgi:hypothetical protein